MKKVIMILLLIFILSAGLLFAQHVVRLGDLPVSDYTINVFQIIGFQESTEGYKLVYLDNNYEIKYLYLPKKLRDKYRIYRPQNNTHNQNFIVVWQKDGKIKRVEWFLPQKINYKLPNYSVKPFSEEDKEKFAAIEKSGELLFTEQIGGTAPSIRAPGGGE
ncbi:MAG: hypothetical protein DRP84_04690 [Spirochaetes bacterium]|nr:MAG: hypothetical protein DRP84_04690 [Spirochaetota bacterium]